MKKITLQLVAFTLALFMMFAFTACEKEGVYNPKQKMKRVYDETPIGKILAQEWTWNKNQLEKIDYYSNNKIDYTERYSYENNKVIKVEGGFYYYKVIYDGSKYQQIEFYFKGTLEESYRFEYENNKITKTTVTIYDNNSRGWKGGFLSSILSIETIESIAKLVEKKNCSKASTQIVTITYKYNGDNIVEQTLSLITETGGIDVSHNVKISYDKYDTKSNNPAYKFIEGGMATSSKNLPLEMREVSTIIVGDLEPTISILKYEYSYSLEKNYPIEIRIKIIDQDGEMYNSTIYVEYQN